MTYYNETLDTTEALNIINDEIHNYEKLLDWFIENYSDDENFTNKISMINECIYTLVILKDKFKYHSQYKTIINK